MAESLDDGEFWLPPKFLNDDDVFAEEKSDGYNAKSVRDGVNLCPFEFPLGFGPVGGASDLGSPVESVVGSSETESDEEEYIAGLTRRMVRSTLEDGYSLENSNGWGITGSPQSTLCAVGSGCGCKQKSSQGSPNGHSDGSHPQVTLDLLYAAAGEVSKLRMNEEVYRLNSTRGLLTPPRKQSPVSIPTRNCDPDFGAYQQLQAAQFLHMRRQQLIEQLCSEARVRQTKGTGRALQPGPQMPQNRGRSSEFFNGRNCRSTGLTSPPAWAPQKQSMNQQNGSGMRAVFLGGKRECAGTGVFLPRQVGTPSDARKKPACSTVLVPARVMQALNLNLDEMCVPPQPHSRPPPSFNAGKNDTSLRLRSDGFTTNQKVNLRPPAALNHDVRLPPEWTY